MGRYFKIINKTNNDCHVVDAPAGSQVLYYQIDDIVGEDKPNPVNDIPHALEVDGWGELACIGETYEAKEFTIECITEEEYDKWQIPNY